MWQSDQLDLARLKQLRHEAEALSSRLSAASEAAGGEFAGRDGDETVEITVGEDGAPTRVNLAPHWRRTVGDGGLGPAVVAALRDAASARLVVWGEHASGDPAEAPRPGDDPDPDPGRGAELGDPSSRQSVAALRDLFDLIGEVTAGLTDLSRSTEEAITRPVTSADPGHTVRVTAAGGTVTGVDFDGPWLRTAPDERIAEAVRRALAQSVRDTAAARRETAGSVPGLDRVRRLTESPETLLREIGLLR